MLRGLYVRDEERRARISLALTGTHRSEETKAKISLAHKGKRLSKEHKTKLSLAGMGNQNALGSLRSEEHKAKMSNARTGENSHMYGKHLSKETRFKISQALQGSNHPMYGKHRSKETKTKISLANTGNYHTEETKARLRLASMGNQNGLGRQPSEETKAKISQKAKQRCQDPEYKNQLVKTLRLALLIHPNKVEAYLGELLEATYPGEWQFVGDGQLIIAGKNPDFWNGDHKLIELFGNYWHGERARCFEETEVGRINLFRQHGYDTLVIWESELKDPDKVLKRIAKFAKKGLTFRG